MAEASGNGKTDYEIPPRTDFDDFHVENLTKTGLKTKIGYKQQRNDIKEEIFEIFQINFR